MEKLSFFYKWFISVGGAVISYMFGGWSQMLGILLTFVVIDYITGIIAAGTEGKLASNIGLKGIAKKVFIFAIVAIAHLADRSLGDNHLLRDATIFFYISNELLSIIENGGRIGVPIPDTIKRTVEVLKGRSEIK